MMPPSASARYDLSRQAQTQALRTAQAAAAQVPAYGRFLRQAGYDVGRLRRFEDFCDLPIMDKGSYLSRYPVAERCPQSDVARSNRVTLSSGSSGLPTLWPRWPEQNAATFAAVGSMLQDHFQIRERWSLIVLTVGVGSWGFGGTLIHLAGSVLSEPGMRGTLVTPGLNVEETFRFVEELSPHYDQTILIGYPAPLAHLLEAGVQRGISWPDINTRAVAGGEYMPMGLRERILAYVGADADRLTGLINLFGTTEVAGIIGYETHLSLLLARLCARTPALGEALFGSPIIPSIIQYNPLVYFIQDHESELLLTVRGAVPLIRYNTRDRGGLLCFEDVLARARDFGYDLGEELRARGFSRSALRPLPFQYVFGRTDGIIVHGINVYTDQVRHALEESRLEAYHTGNLQLSASTDAEGRATICITIELRRGAVPTESLQAQYHARLVEGLLQTSSILRAVYQAGGGRLHVELDLVPYGALRSANPKRPGSMVAQDTVPPLDYDPHGMAESD
jgi:phenylacetate-CoA ligase